MTVFIINNYVISYRRMAAATGVPPPHQQHPHRGPPPIGETRITA